ncbi:MAG: DUF6702 family protein [Planctomycetota bacterium]
MGALAALALAGGLLTAGEHPWHRSHAEIDLRQGPPRIEVALRLDAVDFELYLSRVVGKVVTLDRPEELRRAIERLLAERFLIRSAAGNWSRIEYLGLEADLTECWLYFEAPLPAGPGPLQLSNQLLLDHNAYQENLLLVRDEDFARTLSCTRTEPWAQLDAPLPRPARLPIGWSVRLAPTPGTEPPPPPAVLGPLAGRPARNR